MASWGDRIHWGVIEDARRRQGRERRLIVLAFASALAVALVVYALFGDTGSPHAHGVAASTSPDQSAPTPVVTAAERGLCWFPNRGNRLRMSHNCVRAQPATLLPPGFVKVASGLAPHDDPWVFSLQRLRAQGLDVLCVDQTPDQGGRCFPYPGQPNSDAAGNPPLSATPPILLTGGAGTCSPPSYQVTTGLVMRTGLSVWFTTPTSTRRVPLVRLDPRLGIPGGAFATLFTRGPITLIARDTAGRIVYSARVTNSGDRQSYCSGLDGGYYYFPTEAAKYADLKPRLTKYPFGPFVRATG
jgi:hypothetical protein